MCKYFVTITNNTLNYRLSKEDIKLIHSIRKRRLPAIPAFSTLSPHPEPPGEDFAETGKAEPATQDFDISSAYGMDNQ